MQNKSITIRLIIMNFLQYAIWGSYLTSMSSYLVQAGLAGKIGIFYAMQGIVSIFMPALVGAIADRWIPAQRLLSICHGLGGVFMLGAGYVGMSAAGAGIPVNGTMLLLLYSLSVAFYMPTIALSNSVAYSALEGAGKDTVKDFPPIRVFGTVGFICCMLFVNYMKNGAGVSFQNSYNQFFTSGTVSVLLCLYANTLPNCPVKVGKQKFNFLDATGLRAFKLFKDKQMAIFFIFSMLLGVALQITNGFANPFINSFTGSADPAVSESWGAHNANALISLSQISETLCILLIPFALKKFGIKRVMLISMFAWVLRFGLFGTGNPGPGVWMFILSMIVYGVAFDFFNISGSLYVNTRVEKKSQATAQGLFMLMTNGLGATIGTLSAQAVVNHFVIDNQGWESAWFIFAGYALVVALIFMVVFKNPSEKQKMLSID